MSSTSFIRWVKKKKARIPVRARDGQGWARWKTRWEGAAAPRRSFQKAALTHASHDEELPEEEEEIRDFIQHGHPAERTGMSKPAQGHVAEVAPAGSHLMMFLMSRKNAFRAEVQKLVP